MIVNIGMHKLDVNEAKPSDFSGIKSLIKRWSFVSDVSYNEKEISKELTYFSESGAVIRAVNEDKRTVGILLGFIDNNPWVKEKIVRERFFFIDTEYRNMGIAKIMSLFLVTWGEARDCNSVTFTPTKNDLMDIKESAQKLKEHGFELNGFQMRKVI